MTIYTTPATGNVHDADAPGFATSRRCRIMHGPRFDGAAVSKVLEPRELDARLAEPSQSGLIVLHAGAARGYAEGHVPGALLVEPHELVGGQRPAVGLLPTQAALERLFTRLGHREDAAYVVYDDEGGGWAGRLAWTLDAVGVDAWVYLNGGIHAWRAEGLPIEHEPNAVEPRATRLRLDTSRSITAEELLSLLGDTDLVCWDSRSREEYEGRKVVSARGGRIPGAKHLDWLELMDRSRQLRLRTDLPELLASRGITPDKLVVPYCQTHHRSALSYLVARALGFARVRAYAGSWSEWGNRDDTPIVTGP
jgi:thiosulfate/3-mercaptopyruvate sulfurtransferase